MKFMATLLGATLSFCLLGTIFLTFVKFGLLCFGGGNVLVPIYLQEFVGPDAPMLQLPEEDFGNLLAITQMTPGPISVNAATFFGYKMAGTLGSIVATIGLLAPSFFLMVLALRSLEKWKENPIVKGLLWGVSPATISIIIVAVLIFAEMSVFTGKLPYAQLFAGSIPEGFGIRPFALVLSVLSGIALLKTRLQMTTIIFICAVLGALFLR